jgi:hypothetical protein
MQIKETHLLHVVLISFFSTTTQDMRDEISDRYAVLGEEAGGQDMGILFWSTKPNMDLRKNIHLIEVAIFKDKQSYDNFKNHPRHIEVVELLKNSADWSVGDTIETFPAFK